MLSLDYALLVVGPDPISGSCVTVGQNINLPWEQTDFDFTVGQSCVVHARFLSDTIQCPMVTSQSVCHGMSLIVDWDL